MDSRTRAHETRLAHGRRRHRGAGRHTVRSIRGGGAGLEAAARGRVRGTAALLDSSQRRIARQLPATWIAGTLLGFCAGIGFGVRSALVGHTGVVAGWLAGAAFVPALALALGTVTRGRKTFEAIYVVLWYVGPLNGVAALDFTGASGGSTAPVFAAGTLAALAVAAWARHRRIVSG